MECLVETEGKDLWECPCPDCVALENQLTEMFTDEEEDYEVQFTDGAEHPRHVVVDMRENNDQTNYQWSDKLMNYVKAVGWDVEADPETSCSYFYCMDEAHAKMVAELVQAVWDEGL